MTYADDVLAELRGLLAASPRSDADHDAVVVDAWAEGAGRIAVVYEHRRRPGRFGLRRDVTRWAALDGEDALESATMVRVELDESPPPDTGETDADGVRWWGDPRH